MFWRFPALLLTATFAFSALAAEGPKGPGFLVHLLDYLAKDYGGAVSGGKVTSEGEYHEQVEFSHTATELNKTLTETQANPEIAANLEQLGGLIAAKAEPAAVAKLARQIQKDVIQVAHLAVAPTRWPNLAEGRKMFQDTCAPCHGEGGLGDGPGGGALDPKPANFHSPERMDDMTPYHAFNAIRFGIPGTGMAPFQGFSDAEVWELAFFVVGLRHLDKSPPPASTAPPAGVDEARLTEIATSSDDKLAAQVPGTAEDKAAALYWVRTHSVDQGLSSNLDLARGNLAQALELFKSGHDEEAKAKALGAYLEGVEPVEPRLKAADAQAMSELESRMGLVRSAIEARRPVGEVEKAVASANEQLTVAAGLLGNKASSPFLVFLSAAAILLREGFEAVLLILALLGVLRAAKARRATLWVHGGWIAALGLGVVAWFFSGWLLQISGAQRELMEAVTAVFAVVVLLVVGFWLHSQTEIGRWRKFLNEKVKKHLDGKNLIGLASISFLAVFRECFETVLFLRAVWLENGEGTRSAMAAGVVSSLVLIFVLAWALLRFSAQLPIRKLFTASAVVMAVLAVTLTGKGLHSFQEAGWLTITTPPFRWRWDLFGVYPTWETFLSQGVVLALVTGLWLYGQRPSKAALVNAA